MLPAGAGHTVTMYENLGDSGTAHVSAFAAANAGIARFTENLATELDGTDVVALAVHPGLVRTTITEHLARIDDGQQWVPQFSERAEHRWGDGASTIKLLDRIQRAATHTPSQVASSTSTMILPSSRPRAVNDDGARRLRIQSIV